VVEDDASVARSVVRGLREAGFEVELSADGGHAVETLRRERFDAVVLDLGLPTVSGDEVLREAVARELVVVVLTAASDLPTRLTSFAAGAADFVSKPFFMEELVVRLRARLRSNEPREVLAWDGVTLSITDRTVVRGGERLALTKNELDLLVHLARRPGRAISRRMLAEHAIPSEDAPSERTIDSHVAHLRRKLGAAGRAIQTVWGIGYRFDPGASR
jgi:DNA-binding response OmpR family regulator